tara:strand:+ start:2246 stop:2575 length:330 start_codon:yes stop_codon:yes gene_type:complete
MDELGFVPLSKTGAGLLFELVSQRYERGAALNASNLPFDEWAETFGTERLTGALRDWPPAPCAHVTPNPKLTCFCAPLWSNFTSPLTPVQPATKYAGVVGASTPSVCHS